MKRKINGLSSERIDLLFLLRSVSALLKDSKVDSLEVRNNYGAISLTRIGKENEQPIGFSSHNTNSNRECEKEFDCVIVDITREPHE